MHVSTYLGTIILFLTISLVEMHDSCSATEFRCNDGRCITDLFLCDGDNDCSGGEDELPQNCARTNECTADDFQCSNGDCILKEWMCDGDNDCGDGSDERHRDCSQDNGRRQRHRHHGSASLPHPRRHHRRRNYLR